MRERFDDTFYEEVNSFMGTSFGDSKLDAKLKEFIEQELTQKDQEHKAELESIKKEIDMNRNEACDCTGAKFECEHWGFNQALDYSISILDSHINKLSN